MGLLRLTENREEKKAAYNESLRNILKRSDILDAKAIKDVHSLIRDMQKRVSERIGSELVSGGAFNVSDGKLTDWGLFWVPRLVRSIDDVVDKMAQKAGDVLGEHLRSSWDLGGKLVDDTINAVAPQVSISAERISPITMTVLAPFSAELITMISEETRKQVNKAISVNIATGESPSVLMDVLKRELRGKPSPWKSVAYRAEIITRTEVARAQNLAREARTQQAVLEFPELVQGNDRMQLRFVAVSRGPWPCKICEPLDGTVWEVDDPNKPNPPTSTHPNCRCMLSTVFRGLNSTTDLPNKKAERQADASLSESCQCH